MPKNYDVFLSYNTYDQRIVVELAESLKARGLSVWLDIWELLPGRPLLDALEEIIEKVPAAAVLIGPGGLSPWEAGEMRALLGQFLNRNLPVIPVLLPGVAAAPKLPPFLGALSWVDLRNGLYRSCTQS